MVVQVNTRSAIFIVFIFPFGYSISNIHLEMMNYKIAMIKTIWYELSIILSVSLKGLNNLCYTIVLPVIRLLFCRPRRK